MLISESFVDATEGCRYGETDPYEPYWHDDTPLSKIFRILQREWGKCVSKVYIDRTDGEVWHIGYVFQRKMRYEDTGEPYIREVWVTFHESEPTTTRHLLRLS